MLNINGDENDQFYRYKMPLLDSQIGGKGNGKFTIINNLDKVTEAFNHPSCIVFKFIGYCLGSNITEEQTRLTGHYSNDDLLNKLYRYINSFVLCESCGIPEIIPSLEGKKKKKKIVMKCSACGAQYDYIAANKLDEKGLDLIIKYLEREEWKIKRGTIVENNLVNNPFEEIDFC